MMRALGGILAAGVLALIAAGATIGGVDVWKIVLALAGFALFVAGGRARTQRGG